MEEEEEEVQAREGRISEAKKNRLEEESRPGILKEEKIIGEKNTSWSYNCNFFSCEDANLYE